MSRRRLLPKHLRVQVLNRDSYRCLMCGRPSGEVPLEVDHIKPVEAGGTDALENLGTLCRDCNRGKAAHAFPDYRALPFAAPDGGERKQALWRAAIGRYVRLEPLTGHPG